MALDRIIMSTAHVSIQSYYYYCYYKLPIRVSTPLTSPDTLSILCQAHAISTMHGMTQVVVKTKVTSALAVFVVTLRMVYSHTRLVHPWYVDPNNTPQPLMSSQQHMPICHRCPYRAASTSNRHC